MENIEIIKKLEGLYNDLWPIFRSLTGKGTRETLKKIQEYIPLEIHSVESGKKIQDWTVPSEWSIKSAWIKDEHGNKVIDFTNNHLHIVGYSHSIDKVMSLNELKNNLHFHSSLKKAIPYVISYYSKNWGFCLTEEQFNDLEDGNYHVYIDSELLEDGELNYGELYLPGLNKEEVVFSTLICHPSMANNEMSGMIFNTLLAYLLSEKDRKLSYRFLFLPETIGSICYLDEHKDYLKQHCVGGFMVTCLGKKSERLYLKKTRNPNLKINDLVQNVLNQSDFVYREANFNPSWGCDERQYCSPGLDLPFLTLSSLMFGECEGYSAPEDEDYIEYHTSLDDSSNIDFKFMEKELSLFLDICYELEGHFHMLESSKDLNEKRPAEDGSKIYNRLCPDYEPFMSNTSFYPTLSGSLDNDFRQRAMWVLNYSDGCHSLAEISELSDFSQDDLKVVVKVLMENNLIKISS